MYAEAIECFKQAAASKPENLLAQLGLALTLPHVYPSEAEIDEQRSAFSLGLKSLKARVDQFLRLNASEKIDALQRTNFLLAYHGRDDRALQQDFASFQRTLLGSALPQYYRNIEPVSPGQRRLRVGFISKFFYRSTVVKYFRSWITDLDREKFESVVFSLALQPDRLTTEIQRACDIFHQPSVSLPSLAQAVLDAKLDVIIYPDLGMNARTFAMAGMRLAPLQCAGWGHPVTTGHDNIDVYFSVREMEPPEAEEHYSERLVMLPGIGTSYRCPAVPDPATRSSLGLPENAILYLFPHSLFKIHPHNDELLVDILESEPQAVIVMFRSREQVINQQFSQRLAREFAKRKLPADGRLKILPRVSHQDYLRANLACDVMLDSLYWSGGNTALDAIACSLPMVSLPGDFMRGRQSLAMLSSLGLTELIADSKEDYVRIALRLGRDQDFRDGISTVLAKRSNQLFDQKAPIRALEEFLLSGSDIAVPFVEQVKPHH